MTKSCVLSNYFSKKQVEESESHVYSEVLRKRLLIGTFFWKKLHENENAPASHMELSMWFPYLYQTFISEIGWSEVLWNIQHFVAIKILSSRSGHNFSLFCYPPKEKYVTVKVKCLLQAWLNLKTYHTRIHSSRMRTDYCWGAASRGGGVCLQGGLSPPLRTEWLTYASENITFPCGR